MHAVRDHLGRAAFAAARREIAGLSDRHVRDASAYAHDNPVDVRILIKFLELLPKGWRKVTPEMFEQTAFTGRNAPADFIRWLTTPEGPATNLDLLDNGEDRSLHRGREKLLEELRAFLAAERDGEKPGQRPPGILQVVNGEGLEYGLRAVADILARERINAQDDRRPICFLPVSRYLVDANGDRHAISAHGLVANLLAFVRAQPLPAPPLTSNREVAEAMLEIRAAMAKTPMVLIFDGWASTSGSLSRMHSVAIAEGMVDLLTELVRPRLDISGQVDPDAFYRNRILVLADGETPDLELYSHDEPKKLSVPHRDDLAQIASWQKRGADAQKLAALCKHDTARKDTALAIGEDLILRNWDGDFGGRSPNYDTLFTGWAKRLADAAPLDLLLLRFIAVTRDGLRLNTLLMLLAKWELLAATDGLAAGWHSEVSITAEAVQERLEALVRRRLLIAGRDIKVVGLDDTWPTGSEAATSQGRAGASHGAEPASAATPAVEAPEERLAGADVATPMGHARQARLNDPLRFYDIGSAALRESLIKDLRRDKGAGPAMLARMHRFLAETALLQHTEIARLGDWNEIFAISHYRRLIQALFHGFCSLELGTAGEDRSLRLLQTELVVDPTRAYKRLYSVFYRSLMERPPEWELSRTLGREDLKLEILLLAMNVDSGRQPFQTIYEKPDFELRVPRLLEKDGKAIAIDQALGLARAAFHLNKIKLATDGVAHLEALLALPRDELSAEQKLVYAGLSKIRADVDMVDAPGLDLGTVVENLEHDLAAIGFPWLSDVIELAASCRNDEAFDLKALDDTLTEQVNNWVAETKADPELLVAWSDLLGRWAEAQALHANAQAEDGVEVDDGLLKPFVVMFAAERLRRQAFDLDTLSRDFYVNAHSTRVLVRIVLQLIEAIDANKDGPSARLPERAKLVQIARRHKNMFTRYMSRLPTERVSLLIMESYYTRVVYRDDPQNLIKAHALLNKADALLADVRHRPRVRLRFCKERNVVLRKLCHEIKGDTVEITARRRRLARAALQEAFNLMSLSKHTPSWAGAAEMLFDETAADLAAYLDPNAAARREAEPPRPLNTTEPV